MKTFTLTALLATSILLPAAVRADDDGFVSLFNGPLFNGKDLTGWKMAPSGRWVVRSGTLTLRDRSDGREHNHEYLWTEQTYGDFILELEFKIPPRANSGIFLRTSDLKNPVYTGIEVQVCNSHGREKLTRGGTAGAIYDCLAPTENMVKEPGQWNRCRITCQDSRIIVVLNGRQVIDMDLNRWTEPHKNPDGTPNKFPRPLKDFAREGHVGLQDHGLPVWYRNITIKRLKN